MASIIMRDILNASAKNAKLMKDFSNLADEAYRAEALIKKHYANVFNPDTPKICVYHIEYDGVYCGNMYLSSDFVMEYIDNYISNRRVAFRCDSEGIFMILKACYLNRNGIGSEVDRCLDCKISFIDEYFRLFINSISEIEDNPDDDKINDDEKTSDYCFGNDNGGCSEVSFVPYAENIYVHDILEIKLSSGETIVGEVLSNDANTMAVQSDDSETPWIIKKNAIIAYRVSAIQ